MEGEPVIQGEARRVIWDQIVYLEQRLKLVNQERAELVAEIAVNWEILKEQQ